MTNYYDILEIESNADLNAIKKAYRLKVRKYHPDVAEDQADLKQFQNIQEAYETLSSPLKRWEYDRIIGVAGARQTQKRTLREDDRPTAIRPDHDVTDVPQWNNRHHSVTLRYYSWSEQVLGVIDLVLVLLLIHQLYLLGSFLMESASERLSKENTPPAQESTEMNNNNSSNTLYLDSNDFYDSNRNKDLFP